MNAQRKEQIMSYYLSFDLGGTFVKYALVQKDAEVLFESKVPTPDNLEYLLEFIVGITNDFKQKEHLEGIAISCPGTITEKGEIKGTSAIPYLYDIALKDLIEYRTDEHVSVENDANCAALAELWQGAARDCQEVLTLVIGTGIGGAIISNGRLSRGSHLYAGEFGYSILYADPKNRRIGYWSELGSTGALVRKVAREKEMDECHLSGERIFEWAEEGDEICIQAIEEFYFLLAAGIHNLQHVNDPEVILIGGGISARGDFIPSIIKKVDEVQGLMDLKSLQPVIRACRFKNQANLIGATYHFILSHDD